MCNLWLFFDIQIASLEYLWLLEYVLALWIMGSDWFPIPTLHAIRSDTRCWPQHPVSHDASPCTNANALESESSYLHDMTYSISHMAPACIITNPGQVKV